MMLEHLVNDNHIDIEKEDLNFVQRLIKGEHPGPDHPKSKHFEICSNLRVYSWPHIEYLFWRNIPEIESLSL